MPAADFEPADPFLNLCRVGDRLQSCTAPACLIEAVPPIIRLTSAVVAESSETTRTMNATDEPHQPGRREFLAKAAAVGIGAATTTVPLLAGIATLLDPLRRNAGAGEPVFVTTLSALPEDGEPRRFQIIANRSDVWNKYPNVPVGAVYLRRTSDAKVAALNVACPHAGCSVEFKSDSGSYLCPCHDSTFKLDGTLASESSPSPRGMDLLEVELRHGSEVWVKFQNFEVGKAKKTPVA